MSPLNNPIGPPPRQTFSAPGRTKTGKSGETGVTAFTGFSTFALPDPEKSHRAQPGASAQGDRCHD